MKLYHKKLVKAIALVGSHQCSIDTVIDCRKSDRVPQLLAYAGFKTVDFPVSPRRWALFV